MSDVRERGLRSRNKLYTMDCDDPLHPHSAAQHCTEPPSLLKNFCQHEPVCPWQPKAKANCMSCKLKIKLCAGCNRWLGANQYSRHVKSFCHGPNAAEAKKELLSQIAELEARKRAPEPPRSDPSRDSISLPKGKKRKGTTVLCPGTSGSNKRRKNKAKKTSSPQQSDLRPREDTLPRPETPTFFQTQQNESSDGVCFVVKKDQVPVFHHGLVPSPRGRRHTTPSSTPNPASNTSLMCPEPAQRRVGRASTEYPSSRLSFPANLLRPATQLRTTVSPTSPPPQQQQSDASTSSALQSHFASTSSSVDQHLLTSIAHPQLNPPEGFYLLPESFLRSLCMVNPSAWQMSMFQYSNGPLFTPPAQQEPHRQRLSQLQGAVTDYPPSSHRRRFL